jgi:methylated-DNA-[protein]-cysteine S-methyltransferase
MSTWTTTDTPAGPFTVVADGDVVLASGWTTDVDRLLALLDDDLRPGNVTRSAARSAITEAVQAYCDGDLASPAGVEVRQRSGPFTTEAWAALRRTRPGDVLTYTELAARAGRPAAVRAAASACARNTAALFVPCHRVVRRDHGLGGFAYGLGVKQWLLDHEHVAVRQQALPV